MIGIVRGEFMTGLAVALILLTLPLGVLSVAAWVGIWLPYHPKSLAWRWRHRTDRRGAVIRWGILVVLPYVVVPLIALLLLTPSLVIWIIAAHGQSPRQVGPTGLWLGTAVSIAVSLIVFTLAPAVTSKLARRRLDKLSGYLGDPEHG